MTDSVQYHIILQKPRHIESLQRLQLKELWGQVLNRETP